MSGDSAKHGRVCDGITHTQNESPIKKQKVSSGTSSGLRYCWLDCDPGHDDAMAIILAGYSHILHGRNYHLPNTPNPNHPHAHEPLNGPIPVNHNTNTHINTNTSTSTSPTLQGLHLLGISTVSGNQSITRTTQNAQHILHVAGLSHIPVFQGQPKPLMRPSMICAEIHGESGLDTVEGGSIADLLKSTQNNNNNNNNTTYGSNGHISTTEVAQASAEAVQHEQQHPHPIQTSSLSTARDVVADLSTKAVHALYATLRHFATPEHRITLIATGPLCNVALLIMLYGVEELSQYIHEIVLMGGAVGMGNMGPCVEFNIQVDPEAAHVVFSSGLPVTMVPLEVTHTALVTPSVLSSISSINTRFSQLICDLLLFFRKTYNEVFAFDSPPLHDPCAVMYLIAPQLFTTQFMHVDIETHSTLSAGQTVCDVYGMTKQAPNVTVCTRMNVPAFWDLFLQCLKIANSTSPINQ